MMRLTLILVFVCGFAVLHLPAQMNKDSLWSVWHNTAASDSNRLNAMQRLTWPMLNINLDSVLILAHMQLDYAKSHQQKLWEGKALYNIATAYYYKGDYIRALDYYQQSLNIRQALGDEKGVAAIYGNFGLIYSAKGDNVKNLEYQLKSLAINEKIKDTSGLTSNYSNIALIYQEQQDTVKALEYYNKSIQIFEARKDERGLGLLYNNIGTMYKDFKMWDKSLQYLNKSLEIRSRLNDRMGVAINYVNLGTVHNKLGNYEQARTYTLLSTKSFEALRDSGSLTNTYYTLGEIALNQKDYPQAKEWCDKSLVIARATDKVPVQRAACNCLFRAYKATGNDKKALGYFEEFYMLDDSLNKQNIAVELKRIEFERDLLLDSLSREDEKRQINLAHQAELARKNNYIRLTLILGIGILLLALIFLFRMLRYQRNSQQFRLKSEQLEKQQLVSEIALLKTQVNPHFLFNSLSILSSLVRVDPDLSEKFIDQLSRSYRYILEQKDQPLVTLRTELTFIESYTFLLRIRFENKFNVHIDLPEQILDKYKIPPLTLQLLIENAVKHNRMSVSEPLNLTVTVEEDKMLVIKNNLQPRSTPSMSTGVGLQNIMNRYALMTKFPVWAGEADEQFVVRIPLLT